MLKNTKTRQLVLNLLNTSSEPITANDIFEKLKHENITLSSIYRTLDAFCKHNLIAKGSDANGVFLYSVKSGNEHSHFLECKNCHQKIKLDYCPYHKVNEKIKKVNDFDVDEKNLVIYGTCKNCKK